MKLKAPRGVHVEVDEDATPLSMREKSAKLREKKWIDAVTRPPLNRDIERVGQTAGVGRVLQGDEKNKRLIKQMAKGSSHCHAPSPCRWRVDLVARRDLRTHLR